MKRTLALGGLGTKTGKKHPSHNYISDVSIGFG